MAEKKTTVIVDARPDRGRGRGTRRGVASPAAKRMFTGCRRQGGTGRGAGGRGRGCV